jgi:ribonuclease III
MNDTAAFARLADRLSAYLAPDLLRAALIHRSFCAEAPGEESNERLEFLGDSVLGLLVTETLYLEHPDRPEGDLARMRAALVSTDALARLAEELDLGSALLLGKGEAASGGRSKPSLLADALEAVIGATYLAGGRDRAAELVADLYADALQGAARELVLGDAKNRLQELTARLHVEPPVYALVGHGPDHAKSFEAVVTAAGVRAHGAGRSKKQAERAAALAAIEQLAEPHPAAS